MGDEQALEAFHAEVIGALARLDGKVDTLNARLEASNERTREEIPALFDRTSTQADRIGVIEREYVPRRTFEQHEKAQREDTAALRKSIDGVKAQVTKVMAAGGAILVVVNILLQLWSKMQ